MHLSPISLAFLAACCLVGCTRYGDTPIYGAAHLLSSADYHGALVAIKTRHPDANIHTFYVVSRDEVDLYYTPQSEGGYWSARRINGQWKEDGGTIVIREPILFNGHE